MRSTGPIRAGLLALALLTGTAGVAAAEAPTPQGRWRTVDDKTGRERGMVEIHEQDGMLTGSIVGTSDAEDAKRTCTLCSGDLKDKPILGLRIISGLRRDGDAWTGGEIVDPETGSVYNCSVRLTDGGRKLVLRGYIGISLFGRSQTWLRAK